MLCLIFEAERISLFLFIVLFINSFLHCLAFHHQWQHHHQNLLRQSIFVFSFLFQCRYPRIEESCHCILGNREFNFHYLNFMLGLIICSVLRNHHNFNVRFIFLRTVLIFLNQKVEFQYFIIHLLKLIKYFNPIHFKHFNCRIQN